MTHVGSSLVDPYSAIAASAAALYGPLHGGANEAVIRMLKQIGKVENVPKFIEDVKARKDSTLRIWTSCVSGDRSSKQSNPQSCR